MLFDFGKANRKVSHFREAGSAFSHSLGRKQPDSLNWIACYTRCFCQTRLPSPSGPHLEPASNPVFEALFLSRWRRGALLYRPCKPATSTSTGSPVRLVRAPLAVEVDGPFTSRPRRIATAATTHALHRRPRLDQPPIHREVLVLQQPAAGAPYYGAWCACACR